MGIATHNATSRSNNEIREIILRYLYERNANARSARSDKTGAEVKISVMRRDLKESEALTQSQVRSNLTYLISQGWVEEKQINKSVPTPRGGVIPSTTSYYVITAPGIDKIEGPGEFTMATFRGISIEATGQNVITLGDGNQINSRFQSLGTALAELKEAICAADLQEHVKINAIGDIDSIQGQLAKSTPNRTVISSLWAGVEKTAVLAGLVEKLDKVVNLIEPFIK